MVTCSSSRYTSVWSSTMNAKTEFPLPRLLLHTTSNEQTVNFTSTSQMQASCLNKKVEILKQIPCVEKVSLSVVQFSCTIRSTGLVIWFQWTHLSVTCIAGCYNNNYYYHRSYCYFARFIYVCVRENHALSFFLSQWRYFRTGVIWCNLWVLVTARAAKLRTISWRRLVIWMGGQRDYRDYSIHSA